MSKTSRTSRASTKNAWTLCGWCTRCGNPIFIMESDAANDLPEVRRTCPCLAAELTANKNWRPSGTSVT